MEISKKSQNSGDDSVNLQADNITIHAGLSIAHVKEVALVVFEENFYKLSSIAKETADKRAKEFTEKFIDELAEKNPEGLAASEDPDFQHSLFQAQKEYARCGDRELGDILVDILVDRSKEEERSFLQIVLNESLSIAPKLTAVQLDIIACNFNAGYIRQDINSLEMLGQYLNNAVLIFADAIGQKNSNYYHIEYSGCASISAGSRDFVENLFRNYKAIFCKGFEKESLNEIASECSQIWDLIIPCMNNVNHVQAVGINDEVTRYLCSKKNLPEKHLYSLINLDNQQMMNHQEATELLKSLCPKFEIFLEDYGKTLFKSLHLTSVGIAIAHAHSRRKIGFDADLSIWL